MSDQEIGTQPDNLKKPLNEGIQINEDQNKCCLVVPLKLGVQLICVGIILFALSMTIDFIKFLEAKSYDKVI